MTGQLRMTKWQTRGWEGTYRSIFVHRYGVAEETPWSCMRRRLNSPRWHPVLQTMTNFRTVRVGIQTNRISFFIVTYIKLLDGIVPPSSFAVSRTARSPKSIAIDDQTRIVRSLDALSALTLCICDSQILTRHITSTLDSTSYLMSTRRKDTSQPSKWRITFSRLRQRSWSNYVKEFWGFSHEYSVLLSERSWRMDTSSSAKSGPPCVSAVIF